MRLKAKTLHLEHFSYEKVIYGDGFNTISLFQPYCDVIGNLGVKIAHSPVTT